MNLRMLTNKKGSYILEAAISLPVFIIAVIVMSSVILMYACIEDCAFTAANELRLSASEALAADTSLTVPYRIKKEIKSNHSQIYSAKIVDSGFRSSRWGVDELIIIDLRLNMKTENPLGINASADHDLALATRAYVGKERNENNMSEAEFADEDAEPVYIFPKRGERYHSKGCAFLKAASTSAVLTSGMKKKYRSCPLCHSGKAEAGSLIYYFPAEGEAYHLPGCPSLQRNYITIDRETALKRGYTACSKCGG